MSIIDLEKLIYKKPKIHFMEIGDDEEPIPPGDDQPIDIPGSGDTTGD